MVSRPGNPTPIGEILIQKKLISRQELNHALAEQQVTKEFLGRILVRKKFVTEENFLKVLSEQYGIPYVDLKIQYIDWEVAMRFSSSLVIDAQCLPMGRDEEGIIVAITNPLDAFTTSRIEQEAKLEKVQLVLVKEKDLKEAIQSYKQKLADKMKQMLDE